MIENSFFIRTTKLAPKLMTQTKSMLLGWVDFWSWHEFYWRFLNPMRAGWVRKSPESNKLDPCTLLSIGGEKGARGAMAPLGFVKTPPPPCIFWTWQNGSEFSDLPQPEKCLTRNRFFWLETKTGWPVTRPG